MSESAQISALDSKSRIIDSHPKQMRCFFKDSKLDVVTSGGQRFVNNIRMPIINVYPLEDGILVKAEFNTDLISHEIGASILPLLKKAVPSNKSSIMGGTN